MSDKIIPLKPRDEQPQEPRTLAEILASWPDDKPIGVELRVQEPPVS